MKDTGILFTPENYGKTERGEKVQTRRIIKPQPGPFVHIDHDNKRGWHYWWDNCHSPGDPDVWQEYAPLKCPYGTVGDRLYCKEMHYLYGRWDRDGFTKNGRHNWHSRLIRKAYSMAGR